MPPGRRCAMPFRLECFKALLWPGANSMVAPDCDLGLPNITLVEALADAAVFLRSFLHFTFVWIFA